MFNLIHTMTDEADSRLDVVGLDFGSTLVTHEGEAVEDPDARGRVLVAVPKGSTVLELRHVMDLRDALTEHLSNYPEPEVDHASH